MKSDQANLLMHWADTLHSGVGLVTNPLGQGQSINLERALIAAANRIEKLEYPPRRIPDLAVVCSCGGEWDE